MTVGGRIGNIRQRERITCEFGKELIATAPALSPHVTLKKHFMDEQIKAVEAVLMKYCNPKKEFDNIPPKQVAQEIIDAVKANEPK